MNIDEINNYQHLLFFISQVAWQFPSCWWEWMYCYTLCQFLRGISIIRMETDEFYFVVIWHCRMFTRVGWNTMKSVSSIYSSRCYLPACQYFFFGPSHSAMRLVWNKFNREKRCSDGFRWKMYSGFFLFLLVSPIERALVLAESFPVETFWCFFMFVLVTLSLQQSLSFFIGLFQHLDYGWIVMLL